MGEIKLFDEHMDATNYTIVGDKRMGKTTLLKNLIAIVKKKGYPLIAYDRLNQFAEILPCYETIANVPDGKDTQFCISMDSVENFVTLAEYYREIVKKNGQKLIVVIDELDTFYNRWGPITSDYGTKIALTHWIEYSRHMKVELWGCVRRPQNIWANYLEQSERIFLFHVSGSLAKKKLLETVDSPRMLEAVSMLPPFEYIIYPDEANKYDTIKGNKNQLVSDDE